LAAVRETRALPLRGLHPIEFIEARDLQFHKDLALPAHPNEMCFRSFDETGRELVKEVYYSIGGGFIKRESELQETEPESAFESVPYPFRTAADLMHIGEEQRLAIWQIVLENEKSRRTESEIHAFVD
jgi:L-serine dehydratase